MSRASPRFHRTNPNLNPIGTTTGIVQYVIQGSIEGQMTLSTFMYAGSNPAPTPTQLQTLVTNISNGLFPQYKNMISADWTATRELLRVVHRNDITTAISTNRAGTTGGRPAGHEPTEVAGIVLRNSATKGQHGRGRVSIPAIYTGDVGSSNWTGTTITANMVLLQTAMLATASDGTNTWTPCIGQRSSSPPRLIAFYASLTVVAAQNLLGTVRRRKIGRGK